MRSSGGGAGRAADIGFEIILRDLPRVNDWSGELELFGAWKFLILVLHDGSLSDLTLLRMSKTQHRPFWSRDILLQSKAKCGRCSIASISKTRPECNAVNCQLCSHGYLESDMDG